MKKIILVLLAVVAYNTASFAQSYFVVSSEKIFKAIPAYTQAIEDLEQLEELYIANITNAYELIEEQYNTYKEQASFLSDSNRQAKEAQIIENENKVTEYRENTLGDDGELMKKRIELIQPIQDKVFGIIDNYARNNGYSMVIDISTTPSVVYYTSDVDKTDAIIELLD